MAAAELPGAAFLQRRLARAQAVPPAERSPEVQAFITSVELGRQACELLPLHQSGGEARAALPLGDPAITRRVLQAALKVVQADHLCPELAVFNPDVDPHMTSYYPAWRAASTHGSFHQLASLLLTYLKLTRGGSMAAEEQARIASALQAVLASHSARSAIRQQLEQLSAEQPEGQLPFTWLQLEGACQAQLIHLARKMSVHLLAAAPTAAQRRTVEAAQPLLQAAINTWRQLEPSSLKAVAATAIAEPHIRPDPQYLPPLRRALQLAQQQRSPYWVVRCAAMEVLLAMPVPCDASELRAVMEDFSQVEPALQTCKRLLPQPWVTTLNLVRQAAAPALPMLRSRLAALESGAAASPLSAVTSAIDDRQLDQFGAAVAQQWQELDAVNKCAGCGRHAVGLRACSRCRAVKYCSVECQRAAWPQHKRECRPA